MAQILSYLRKDLLLEIRRGYALGGLVVFILCIVYLIYLGFGRLEGAAWITMYWIAFLFLAVQTVLKGFALEDNERFLYYYTLIKPESLFLAKAIYHSIALFALGVLLYFALVLIVGNPFGKPELFILAILLGAVGISLCFTFVSAIAVKSDQSTTLMTILSFPLIVPVFLHLIRLSQNAIGTNETIYGSLITLCAIYLLLLGLGLLLFPYLWRS